MTAVSPLTDVARIPAPGDNVAIAVRRLDAGTDINAGGYHFTLSHTIMEGHRFAVMAIPVGAPLLSWGLPFGIALRPIQPGDYVCNSGILDALGARNLDFALPVEPNFKDDLNPYILDESTFQPGAQVPPYPEQRYFKGYRRPGNRGVGTRNFIVVLGTTSRATGFARAIEERLSGVADSYAHVDGIVAVTHTEGGISTRPNNLQFLLRTLSGFMVHPNVGAVLAVDYGREAVTNDLLRRYMAEHDYPLDTVPHAFLSVGDSFQESVTRGAETVESWLEQVNAQPRTDVPLSTLKVALQCGGSDAFSGVSGNPLAALVARHIIGYGGSANLAETDELIGAEPYVLQNVRDVATARAFLGMVEQFKERLSWHGHTAEGNPSGGNKFRGLYNIAIKSIGAAMKRDPAVRLDYVIDYAERMDAPGYYFMNSPGNDLESIAGQVASGCNMIYFVTGNGSITNFPFVPTIKVVTTTGRFNLLSHEMDVNAGAYLDGEPMDELARRALDLTVAIASGERSQGEKAGHSQVSIWRNWLQRDRANLIRLQQAPLPSGRPLAVREGAPVVERTYRAVATPRGPATDQIGLVMPTSLCAGQIARKIADHLNVLALGGDRLSRYVALPHTEGCGSTPGASEDLYARTVIGHLTNPVVGAALLLEHGCEKTHNDYFQNALRKRGVDPQRFGWASIQLDGGIERVTQRVEEWFGEAVTTLPRRSYQPANLGNLHVAIASLGAISDEMARRLADLTRAIVRAGGTVVVPERATVLASPAFAASALVDAAVTPTLAYGQNADLPGLHVMEAPTDHWVETATGLAATGVELMLAHVAGPPVLGHRMIPVLQVTSDPETRAHYAPDLDLVLEGDPSRWLDDLLDVMLLVASRAYVPRLHSQGNTDFQFTRGLLGVSV